MSPWILFTAEKCIPDYIIIEGRESVEVYIFANVAWVFLRKLLFTCIWTSCRLEETEWKYLFYKIIRVKPVRLTQSPHWLLRSSKNYGHSLWLDGEAAYPSWALTEHSRGRGLISLQREEDNEENWADSCCSTEDGGVLDGVLLNTWVTAGHPCEDDRSSESSSRQL